MNRWTLAAMGAAVLLSSASLATKQSAFMGGATAGGGVPNAPALSAPANAATNQAVSLTLSWSASVVDGTHAAATSYTVMFDTAATPVNTYPTCVAISATTCDVSGLLNGTPYYWQIVPTNGFGVGNGSDIRRFDTIVGVPQTPTFLSPADNATNISAAPLIQWTCSGGTTSTAKLDATAGTPTTVVVNNQPVFQYQASGLIDSTQYGFSALCTNASGSSSTTIIHFTTGANSGNYGGGGYQLDPATNLHYLGAFKSFTCGSCGTIKSYNADHSVNNANVASAGLNNASGFGPNGGLTYSSTAINTNGINLATAGATTSGGANTAALSTTLIAGCRASNLSSSAPYVAQLVGEVSIPASLSTSSSVSSWPVNKILTPCNEPTEGKFTDIYTQTPIATQLTTSGMLQVGAFLFVAEALFYDTGFVQQRSHFRRPLNLTTTGSVDGPYQLKFPLSGFTSYVAFTKGWMAAIPPAWQCGLTGHPGNTVPCSDGYTTPNDILTGSNNQNGYTGAPVGYAAIGWYSGNWPPGDCTSGQSCGTADMYHTSTHPIMGVGSASCNTNPPTGDYPPLVAAGRYGPTADGNCLTGTASTVWTQQSKIGGAVIPTGTSSLLTFSMQGAGIPCYGNGVSNAAPFSNWFDFTISNPAATGKLAWTCTGGNYNNCANTSAFNSFEYCTDIINSARGNHAYPYGVWINAFSLTDLMNSARGNISPWTPAPYSTYQLTLPGLAGNTVANFYLDGVAVINTTGCGGITGAGSYHGCIIVKMQATGSPPAPYYYVWGFD